MGILNESITILKVAIPELLVNYPIKSMAIFGSVSRKEDSKDSDIDILVEFDAPIGLKFIHLAYELEKLLKRKVDLVSKEGIKNKYFNEIKLDLIYV